MATRADLLSIAALKRAREARQAAAVRPLKGDKGERGESLIGPQGLRGEKGRDGIDGKVIERVIVERPIDVMPDVEKRIEEEVERLERLILTLKGKKSKAGDGPILQMRAFTRPTNITTFELVGNSLRLTFTDGSTLEAPVPFDDYTAVEYLDDQISAGAVLTFTFTQPVQKVWVEMLAANADDVSTARVRVDGVAPDADTGTPLHAGQTQPISAPSTTTVKVLAPSGKTITCYGYRR